MDEGNRWKVRALFAEWAHRWNGTIKAVKCTDEQRQNAEFARAWYLNNRHLKPGEAAQQIHDEICDQEALKEPPPEDLRTIISWIRDLAPPESRKRGRPRKK